MLAGVEVGRWTSICSRSGSRWLARRVAATFAFYGALGYSRLWGVIEASLASSGADIVRAFADAAGGVGLWGVAVFPFGSLDARACRLGLSDGTVDI